MVLGGNMQVQKEQIKFIKDKEQLGIVYDWNKIFKYYRALKCPDDCYEPTHVPMNAIDYMVGISKRSRTYYVSYVWNSYAVRKREC